MGARVLVIDDEIEICRLLKDFLEKQGFEVSIATSALDGIEKVRTERPKVVLLDVRMPEMDGMEVMRKIREIDRDVGVILATAVRDEQIAQEALNLGAVDYIIKPFDLSYLKNTLTVKLMTLK
ncbi:MAG: response regulator [Candidatus Omnitrophica bacterium]|nr:response regulator [Candidatus Omnitrophota bacterium]